MRRLPLLLSSILFLLPLPALAAFGTPSELFRSFQEDVRAKSFSMTITGASQNTYVALWTNGKEKANVASPALSMNVTVDIVQNGMKVRIKGAVMALENMLYLKISSVTGKPQDAFASLSQEKRWIAIPFNQSTLSSLTSDLAIGLTSTDPSLADSRFLMTKSTSKGLNIYSLSLSPDFAPDLALSIRNMLNDTNPASDDFFPWRELGESVKFTMTTATTGQDVFVSNTFTLSMKSKYSSFSVKGAEQSLTIPFVLVAPSDAVTLDALPGSFGPLLNTFLNTETQPKTPITPSSSASSSEAACTDSATSPQLLLELKRTGVCPTAKTSTRVGGW
jgi:hypothetical protein